MSKLVLIFTFLFIFTGLIWNASAAPSCAKLFLKSLDHLDESAIEYNYEQYLVNVRKMSQNENLLFILRYLKTRSGGVMSKKYAAAIAALKYEAPEIPTQWQYLSLLKKHYAVHAKQFGIKRLDDYTQDAIRFAGRISDTSLILKAPDGGWVKYDPVTTEYLVISAENKILNYFLVTMFSPERHFEHFLNQFYGFRSKRSQFDSGE